MGAHQGRADRSDPTGAWQDAGVSSLWCFQCGAEYDPGVETCVECGVGLVTEAPLAPEDVGTSDEEQLAYELHDWSFESRRMLDQLLTGAGLAHSWQGATMIVRAVDEDAVDDLVEEVEHATLPTLDPDAEHTVYEMNEWTSEQQSRLTNMLGMAGLAHEFDGNGDLVVNAEDEAAVDAVLDRLEDAIALGEPETEDVIHFDDDLQVNDLLSNAFDAADRIKGNTHDHEAILEFLESEAVIDRVALPYGFERESWDRVRLVLGTLRDSLEADDPDDDKIVADAKRVRDALVQII
jgi:glutathione S-transferase